jgi:uncharacterized repeat protein (TIGR01451 family)
VRRLVAALVLAAAMPLAAATLEPVSRTAPGLPNDAGNAGTETSTSAISADGCLRVFSSGATNLVPDQQDINGAEDVFLHDCSDGSLSLLSHRFDDAAVAANSTSTQPSISRDGRWIAFHSYASDLIDGITRNHGNTDLYLYDRQNQTLVLVNTSANDPGVSSELGAGAPVFSGDSAWMVFASASTDVLPNLGDDNNGSDQFLYQLATGAKTLITRRGGGGFCIFAQCTANEGSGPVAVSDNGQFVAFASGATNLVAGQSDTPGTNDVFVWNRATNTSVLVSHASGGPTAAVGNRSENPTISGDGAFVAFSSHATNLVAGQTDANGDSDVFVFERATGGNVLASHLPASPTTTDGDGWSGNPVLNGDGSLLAYTSVSQDLVAGQNDASPLSDDLFLFARASGVNTLVSHAAGSATTTGSGSTVFARFSGDGQFLVFASRARNLVAGQVDGNDFGDALMGEDIFRHALAGGTTQMLSHRPGQPAAAGRFMSYLPSTDATAQHVLFISDADDLSTQVDNNDARDVYLWSAADDTLVLASRRDAGADPVGMIGASEAVVSADGRYVAFVSGARNVYPGLVDDDSDNTSRDRDDDIFLLDRQTGTYVLVSHSNAGLDITANNDSRRPRLSGDGRYVVFESAASDLLPGQTEGNGTYDVFLFDRNDRSLRLVSHVPNQPLQTGNALSNGGEVGRDGTHVVFTSTASNLIQGGSDGNGQSDVFLYTLADATLRLVSRSSGSATTAGNGDARFASISADGRFVAYHSSGTNHVGGADINGETDVFVFDREAGGNPNRLVSRSGTSASTFGDGASRRPRISADGNYIAFLSTASNLLSGPLNDGNGEEDAFLFDRNAGFAPNVLVSRLPNQDSASGDAGAADLSLSDDGSRVVFLSQATNLAEDQLDTPFTSDLFLFERDAATVTLVSQSVFNPGQAVGAERAAIAGDGSVVLFDSRSWELAEGLQSAESESKTWLYLVAARSSVLLSRSVLGPGHPPRSYALLGDISADGAVSVFLSPSPDIVTFDGNGAFAGQPGLDAFAFERALGVPTVGAPPDQQLIEDQAVGPLPFTVGDPDGDVDQLLLTASSSNPALVPNGNILLAGSGADRTVSVTPLSEQNGSVTITLRAADADGNIGSAQFTLDYAPLNDPPGFVLPGTASILEGQNTGLLDFTVDDPDHDENDLLLSVSSSDPAVVPTAGIALAGSGANRRIRVTPAPDRFGAVTITVSGEDPDGAIGGASFEVEIANINDAPVFTVGPDTASDEDEAVTRNGWATGVGAGPFESMQQVSFEITGNSNPALFASGPAVSADGTLTYTPAADASGDATITLRARDDGGVANGGSDASPTQSFAIQVNAQNDLPSATGAAQVTVVEDGSVVYDFTIGDAEDATEDLDVSVGTSDGAMLPLSGLQLGGSGASRTLAITPAPDLDGNGFVFLTVTDSQDATRTLTVEVIVTPVDEQVDLVAEFSNGVDFLRPGDTVTWHGSVFNVGDDTAYDAALLDNAPAGLSAISWTCMAFDGASCSVGQGSGPLDLLADLPPDGYVDLAITATVEAAAMPQLAYSLQADAGPGTQEATPADNLAIDSDPVGERVFADGFED